MNRLLLTLAILLGGTALVVSLMRGGGTSEAPARTSDLTAQFEKLQREHLALQRSHDELVAKLEAPKASERASAESPVDRDSLAKRLHEMQAELERTTLERDPYGVVATQEKELIDAYNALFDKSQPVLARVKNVQQLKRFGYFDDAARQAATALYSETDDINERAFILDALKGSVPVEFREQILADLNTDVSAGYQSALFRYRAIEALEPMVSDPVVRQWLTHLAESDPEPKLASRAGQALGLPSTGRTQK